MNMIKKYLKITKRIIALFVILVLNMSSFAAVGANDGSAFVTKAEFDALVNTSMSKWIIMNLL